MPWNIMERDGKHCVVVEDTGEAVKCHADRKAAVEHMQALYAAEGVEKSLAEIEKSYYDAPYLFAATSFAEMEQMEAAMHQEMEMREVLTKFVMLLGNIVEHPGIPDKKGAIQALTSELMVKMGEVEDHQEEMDDMEKATWSAAYINNLPDSCFLLIEPGGKKDADGKTTPRSLRHLPIMDAEGNYDQEHVRNAIQRAPQVKLSDGSKISPEQAARLQAKARKHLKSAQAEKSWTVQGIEKGYDDEKRLVYGIVLNPDVVDSQGDIMSAEEIEKAAHAFVMKSRLMDHQHEVTLDPEVATPVESYIAPVSFRIGDQMVRKGAWVLVTKVFDDTLWSEIRSGTILSYSISGYGMRTPIS